MCLLDNCLGTARLSWLLMSAPCHGRERCVIRRAEKQVRLLAPVPGSTAILLPFLTNHLNSSNKRKHNKQNLKKNLTKNQICYEVFCSNALGGYEKDNEQQRGKKHCSSWSDFFQELLFFLVSQSAFVKQLLFGFLSLIPLSWGREGRAREEDNCCFSLPQDRTPWTQCCPSALGWGSPGNGAWSCEDQFCVRCWSCGR